MAQGSSNEGIPCKRLPCLLFIVCFGLIKCNCEEYYIVPSQGYPCCVDHCFTLSQFVDEFTNCSNCYNAALIFVPGNHSLEMGLTVEDVHSFSMFAELISSMTQVICHLNAMVEFRNVSTVAINGLDFF